MDQSSAAKKGTDLTLVQSESPIGESMKLHTQFLETFFAGINASAIIAMTDLEGNITFVNDRFV